jgi:hypothetical protein
MDTTLQWKSHIDLLLTKQNATCYDIRTLKYTVSQLVLFTVYFPYFHPIMSYGIIFWGASPHCNNIFKLQQNTKNTGEMESRTEVFGKLKILNFYSQYIYSLLCFACNNKERCICKLDIHGRHTRYGSDFHYPVSYLALIKKVHILWV